MKRPLVKVCGITSSQDGRLAERLGASFIGMIFYRSSPRFVTVKQAQEIAATLLPSTHSVGVFVNEDIDRVVKLARRFRLGWIQLHGQESVRTIKQAQRAGLRVIKAFGIRSKRDFQPIRKSPADLVLLDNASRTQPGGTGEPFDWLMAPKPGIPNLVLAGGLCADNVWDGVKRFQPLVVDVNSGVESRPGVKSAAKLRKFMSKLEGIK